MNKKIKKYMNISIVCKTIFRLYLYADTVKKIHYVAKSNHIHELCDEIRDSIVDFADSFAEQYFGYSGKPEYKMFPKLNTLDIEETADLKAICEEVISIAEYIKKEVSKNEKLSGIVSLVDDFKGKFNKYIFLSTFDKFSKG